jgi:hypothetical protein
MCVCIYVSCVYNHYLKMNNINNWLLQWTMLFNVKNVSMVQILF